MTRTRNAHQTPRLMRLLIASDTPELVQFAQQTVQGERDILVIGVATSGREAIQKATLLRPDVVLLDLDLRDLDGLQVTEAITSRIQTGVVLMSVHAEPEYLSRAMMVGARGYLITPLPGEMVSDALHSAWHGMLQSDQATEER